VQQTVRQLAGIASRIRSIGKLVTPGANPAQLCVTSAGIWSVWGALRLVWPALRLWPGAGPGRGQAGMPARQDLAEVNGHPTCKKDRGDERSSRRHCGLGLRLKIGEPRIRRRA